MLIPANRASNQVKARSFTTQFETVHNQVFSISLPSAGAPSNSLRSRFVKRPVLDRSNLPSSQWLARNKDQGRIIQHTSNSASQ